MALPAPRHCLRLVTAITEGGSHLAALPIALELLDVRGNDAGIEEVDVLGLLAKADRQGVWGRGCRGLLVR